MIEGLVQRPMRPADVPAVAALEAELAAYPWTPGHFADSLAVGYACDVLECSRIDGCVVPELMAYRVWMQVLDEVHLLNVGVAPSWQKKGVAKALLEDMAQVALTRGCISVWLEVRPSNHAARTLYERMGFVEVGRRKGYYPAAVGREDALVLKRNLSDSGSFSARSLGDNLAP